MTLHQGKLVMSDYTSRDIRQMFGVTRMTIWRWEVELGVFPKRYRTGNGGPFSHVRWPRAEVDEYMAGLLRKRHTAPEIDPEEDDPSKDD